jgi:hypothetical protein
MHGFHYSAERVLTTLSTESKIQESHKSLSHLKNVYINSQISPDLFLHLSLSSTNLQHFTSIPKHLEKNSLHNSITSSQLSPKPQSSCFPLPSRSRPTQTSKTSPKVSNFRDILDKYCLPIEQPKAIEVNNDFLGCSPSNPTRAGVDAWW